jgi:hypothetical protein
VTSERLGADRAVVAMKLANTLELELRRHPAAVRGAVLAHALAAWLASLPEQHREGHFDDHIASVRRMLRIVLEIQRPDHDHTP